MTEILALLQDIVPVVSTTILHQMSHMIYGMLINNGWITILEISRRTETGAVTEPSNVCIIRPWPGCTSIGFFTNHLQKPHHEYIAAGDESVFGNAGKETCRVGRFFSSLQNCVIPGLSFFVFSVMDVKERQSYPIQMVKDKEENKKKNLSTTIRTTHHKYDCMPNH